MRLCWVVHRTLALRGDVWSVSFMVSKIQGFAVLSFHRADFVARLLVADFDLGGGVHLSRHRGD